MKIRPGRRYTPEQLRKAMSEAQAKELQFKGYVLQFDVVSQTYAVVPWREAAVKGQGVFDPLPPIQKRTPMERVDSLMLKMVEDCKRAGTVPGLSDERINEIVGAAKGTKRDGITAEDVRKVAAHLLQEAENKHEAKLATQITRHED